MIPRESAAHPLCGDDPEWLLCECVRMGGWEGDSVRGQEKICAIYSYLRIETLGLPPWRQYSERLMATLAGNAYCHNLQSGDIFRSSMASCMLAKTAV